MLLNLLGFISSMWFHDTLVLKIPKVPMGHLLQSAWRALFCAHRSLAAQVQCLTEAWQWQASDTILHALPLHHTHGIVNALHCAHAVGGCVKFLPKFSPARVWEELMVSERERGLMKTGESA
jgi:acyl-CoA synthetase (AMP-forming)/AMP-acid ligase II